MTTICKKHNKPRSVIYGKKMPKGGIFELVGCEDCAAEALQRIEESHPEKSDPPKPTLVREKTLGERFGFKR